jgi:hypothetical protein
MAVKDNYVVIRMDVAAGTQWGSSWGIERACGRGAPGRNHRDAPEEGTGMQNSHKDRRFERDVEI